MINCFKNRQENNSYNKITKKAIEGSIAVFPFLEQKKTFTDLLCALFRVPSGVKSPVFTLEELLACFSTNVSFSEHMDHLFGLS